jgi:putative sigma-54 modulation protein
MRLELTGRHVTITPSLRRLVEGKLGKLERMLNDSALSAQAVLTREKHRHRADITLHTRGEKFLHGVGNTGSWEASVADAIEKITQQAHKVKGKWQERKRRRSVKGVPAPAPAAGGELREPLRAAPAKPRGERMRMPRILRASRQAIRTMSVSDAARQIDVDGDGVVVFRDPDTSVINVLFRRRNGELTLVETEA